MKKYNETNELLPSTTTKSRKRKRINSIIIHTTGYGKGLERIEKKCDGDLALAGKMYAERMAKILRYKGHFLLDHTGMIYQFLDLDDIAWHTGGGKKRRLKIEEPFEWWTERWKGIVDKPTDLPSWDSRPNNISIGIDLLAFSNGPHFPNHYTELQIESLARLVGSLCKDYNIPLDRKHIVGHEDVDPISRGRKKGGWDPGRKFDWDYFMAALGVLSDANI
jgi:N-acetyl-anhydromuramyl-L-alanine amidase AmpD